MRKPAEERFWEKVNKNGPIPDHRPELGPCWLWLAARKEKGYGSFWDGHRTVRAHRFSYELLIGVFPKGLVPDHLCRIPWCVNPYHIEPVTSLENCRRGNGAWAIHRGSVCSKGHPLSGDNLGRHKLRGRDHRQCLICRKASRDKYRKSHPRLGCPGDLTPGVRKKH